MDSNPAPNQPVYERLAYEAALRALDKQERLIDELRSRTGLLLAAASLAASFLGREAFVGHPKRGFAILALYEFRDDLGEVYRHLAYDLDRFWDDNDVELQKCSGRFVLPPWGYQPR